MSSRYRREVLGLTVISLAAVARSCDEEVKSIALQLQGQSASVRRRWLLIAMSMARRDNVDISSRRWACKVIAAAKLSFYAPGGTTLKNTYAKESLGDYVCDDLDASILRFDFGRKYSKKKKNKKHDNNQALLPLHP